MEASKPFVDDSPDFDSEKVDYIEPADSLDARGPMSTFKMLASVHVIAVLLLVAIVLLTSEQKGPALSGRLVAGNKLAKGCANISEFGDVPVQTTPKEMNTTTLPWCDEEEEEPPCRSRRVPETTPTATLPDTHSTSSISTQRTFASSRASTTAAPTVKPTASSSSLSIGSTTKTPGFPADERPTLPASVTLKTRFTRPKSMKSTSAGTTATTTTRMPLVCTLGSKGTAFITYPTPGLCSHVLYTHVLVSDGKLRDWQGGNGWKDFVQALQAEDFTDYPGGVSFDVRQSTAAASLDIPYVRKELQELSTKNIKHYGILNIVTRAAYLHVLVAAAGEMITRLRQLQGGDRSRNIIVAAGLWTYEEPNAWATYEAQFKVLASFDVDILITRSSVSTMETEKHCFAAPPTVWNTVNASFPGFDKHAELLMAWQPYHHQDLYVGLSFEMGVMLYRLKDIGTPRDLTPYAPCTQFALVGYEQVCDPNASLSRMDALPTEFGAISSYDFFYDSWETMKRKVERVMKLQVRSKVAWMLFDTHLSDITWNCTAPRDREKKLKEYLGTFG